MSLQAGKCSFQLLVVRKHQHSKICAITIYTKRQGISSFARQYKLVSRVHNRKPRALELCFRMYVRMYIYLCANSSTLAREGRMGQTCVPKSNRNAHPGLNQFHLPQAFRCGGNSNRTKACRQGETFSSTKLNSRFVFLFRDEKHCFEEFRGTY